MTNLTFTHLFDIVQIRKLMKAHYEISGTGGMMKSLATFIVWPLLLVLLTFTAASGGERPRIVVGGDHENPPYEFLENGEPTGFNIELIRAVAEAAGIDVEFRLGAWSKVRQELEQGKIDALAGMYYSPKRSQLLDFSVPHTMVTSGIFVRNGSPIRSIEDIKGKEVIVQKGDVIHDYLREHNLTPHIFAVTNPADELRLLASGRHDCAVMPSRFQGEYLKRTLRLNDLRDISTDLPPFRYCFAVRKGNQELLYRLDEGLNILKVNGKYREIYEKWFGVYEKKDLWGTIKYYVLAIALSLALFLGFLIWSGMLKRRVEQRTAELRRSEEELRQAHDELEKRVEERTADLQKANELLQYEIAERKQAEEALRESESRVRRKLESILDPEGDIGELDLADIIDTPGIQALMDDLYRNTGLKMSIIDLKGRVLVDVGWQDICLKFHRAHPETLKNCHESDTDLTVGVPQGEFKTYRCRNNMWHLVTPIFVGGRHMGNLFMGQFFFENEELDYGLFHAQARQYGFPEEEYIAALKEVPRYSEECVNKGKAFFLRLIGMFSKLSYGNIKLARSLAERDRLTETLRESEARLKLAMDLAKLGAWEYYVDTGMFSFDEQFYALYGTTAEREGGPLMSAEVYARKFIPPEESAAVANGIEEVRVNSHFQLEHRIIRADGEERFIVVHGEAVFDQEGRFVKIRGANQDITERKRAEEELRKANMVVENSPVVLFRCKAAPSWPVELVSKNVVQFGYTPEEFLSGELTFSSIVYPRDLGKLIAETEEYSATGKGKWLQEYRIVTKEGDIRWIVDETVCERNEAGEITHYEGVVIDVTERRKAEEQLILQQMQLRELNRTLEERVHEEVEKNRGKDIILIQQNRQAALGEMFDHIAHQWKQPLNTIAVIIQALGSTSVHDQVTTKDILETVDSIMDMVGHMAQTVDVFRNFYRPDKEKSAFLVKDSIEKALNFVVPVFRRYGIEVDLDADPELSAFGYPKEYAQVLLNILGNAKDAFIEKGAENPRINIKAFADGDNTVVTITDNAGGVPDLSIESIFDLNFTTKESSGGTGIGLYMSRNIIEKNMGGRLSVTNIDDGAQFRIELGTT